MGRSAMDSTSAKSQVVVSAVGPILRRKWCLTRGSGPRYSAGAKTISRLWQTSMSATTGSSPTNRREEMRETARTQGIPRNRSYANKTELIRWPFPTSVLECPGSPCQYRSLLLSPSGCTQHSHCPRHCLLQRYISSGQPLCAAHTFLGRTTFLQGKMQTMQRKTLFSHSTLSMG